ncbi:MAG: hypothetical protein NDI58_02135 [Geothrix sp.]|nr:hypothetical protein [Geothrix sp.]
MKVPKTFLMISVSGIVGGLVGGLLVSRHWARLTSDLVVHGNGSEALQLVHELRLVHQGNTAEAMGNMEVKLDGHILSLGHQAANVGPGAVQAKAVLQKIAAYRRESPYVPADSDLKSKIDQALSAAIR